MKILNKIYLILAIIFSILGSVQIFRWFSSSEMSVVGYFIGILPALLLFASYFLSAKLHRKVIHLALIPICIFAIYVFGCVSIGVEMWESATTEITEVDQYTTILNEYWANSGLVRHFPKDIPPDAQDTKFSFLPAFLQGGTYIQLRYSTDSKQINTLYDQFSSQKIASFFGGDANIHGSINSDVHTTFFYTSNSDDYEFPDDYEIIVLAGSCDPENCGTEWTHRKSSGVAISQKRNEIVYWAEAW